MKFCPYCNFNYSDNSLEFCLEDGTRLVSTNHTQNQISTVSITNKTNTTTEKTVSLPFSDQSNPIDFQGAKNVQTVNQSDSNKEKSIVQNYKILEISSITVSLTHNWWQWLYLNNQYYSTFSSYILSANFLMWLLLIAAGTAISLYTLKKVQNKALPVTSLIVLAINLILFLVPKR